MNESLARKLDHLEGHLREENPILLDAVRAFRRLDEVAWKMGLLPPDHSLASQVPWWPLIAVLGTFSAGKSTFINGYLGQTVQVSGNQAVDDRFTAICFSAGGGEGASRALPGLALDADPRFPFYQVSRDIEGVAAGEGRRIDAYLQLKTCPSPQLRGKIIIDSPGFDADEQRTSILRISDHIIGLADLVLVFFDARHPEPGAMRDTLRHLVERAVGRADSSKFLYVLNQVDNTAREDNPEEVFGAWQRALASSGLTAGRFYQIYDEASAVPIENEGLRARFRAKRDADLAEIRNRMEQVEVERAYRVIGMLEKLTLAIRDEAAPALERARRTWRRRVLWADAGLLAAVAAAAAGAGAWIGFDTTVGWLGAAGFGSALGGAVLLAAVGWVHFRVRRIAARAGARQLLRDGGAGDSPIEAEWVARAFEHGAAAWRTMWISAPAGWGSGAKQRVASVLEDTGRYVQRLNDRFADPSGGGRRSGPDRSGSGPDTPDRGDRDEAGEGHGREHPEPATGAGDREQPEEPRL